ncbi:MAG: hypothetical protein JXJ18_00160 [Rhodobacteraceae bacterium]|nr:hypothetical protein [Paracoccaceae bacterium]
MTRVILGATSFAEAEASLALATALAVDAGAELLGLMIDDAEVLALSSAHGAQIIAPGGQSVAPPPAADMRAALARDAARFQHGLQQAATRAALGWRFARLGGSLAGALADLAEPGDLLVVAAGPLRSPIRDIVLLSAPQTPAAAPLRRAADVAASHAARPLRVLAQPDTPPDTAPGLASGTDPALLAVLGRLGPGSVLFTQMAPDGAALVALLRATRCTHVLCWTA